MKISPLVTYIISRIATCVLTIFTAVTMVFIFIKLLPVDVIENMIQQLLNVGAVYDPETINRMRETLREVFGLTHRSPLEEYLLYLRRVFTLDFGPSFINFPTPAFALVLMRLPWTIGLLSVSTVIAWILGNILGVLAGYFRNRAFARILESIAISLYPIPYYIFALILILIFAATLNWFPLGGGVSVIIDTINIDVIRNIVWHATLPALSLIIPGALGWSFLSSRALALNIMSEEYYRYAKMRGLPEKHIRSKYVFRNILVPQTTVLTLSLGGIFTGAILTEAIFSYPGVGSIVYRAAFSGDINTLMAALIFTIFAISFGTLFIDLIYPLIDPRIRYK